MKTLKTLLALTLLSCCCIAPIAQAEEFQLPQLMQMLSRNKSGAATFTEKKYLGIITEPVVSSGELAYTAPDRLEKRTLKPIPETLILNGDRLTIARLNKRPHTVSLEEHPEVSSFIASIRGTLAGDLSMLEKHYTLKLTGTSDRWQLLLTPRQVDRDAIFSGIRIAGSHGDLNTIDMMQSDGDHSEMLITR